MYRQTFVIEYASIDDAPRINPAIEALGGRLVAVQFGDALQEIEILHQQIEDKHESIETKN